MDEGLLFDDAHADADQALALGRDADRAGRELRGIRGVGRGGHPAARRDDGRRGRPGPFSQPEAGDERHGDEGDDEDKGFPAHDLSFPRDHLTLRAARFQ